jgi:hypothetical protein
MHRRPSSKTERQVEVLSDMAINVENDCNGVEMCIWCQMEGSTERKRMMMTSEQSNNTVANNIDNKIFTHNVWSNVKQSNGDMAGTHTIQQNPYTCNSQLRVHVTVFLRPLSPCDLVCAESQTGPMHIAISSKSAVPQMLWCQIGT